MGDYINGRLADAHPHFTVTFNSGSAKPGRAFKDKGRIIGIALSTHDSAPEKQWELKSPAPVCISGVVAVEVNEDVLVGEKACTNAEGKIGTTGTKLNAIFLENGEAGDVIPLLIYGGAA